MIHPNKFWIVFCLGAGVLLAPRPSLAQATGDEAAARVLFDDGRRLEIDAKFEQACPKFEESLRLHAGIGTQFNLADCWEHIGRTASAWTRFLDTAATAEAAGQTERARVARERAAALQPKLSNLVIEVKAPDAKLEVRRDGVPVGRASWGTPLPVDPGTHTVEAVMPGAAPWSAHISVPPSADTTTISIPALTHSDWQPPVATQAPLTPPPELAASTLSPKPDDGSFSPNQRTIALIVGGVGAVGVVAGTIFGLSYMSNNSDAASTCPSRMNCSLDDIAHYNDVHDKASSERDWSYATFGIGAAALAVGAVLWVTAKPTNAQSAWSGGISVANGSWSGALRGQW